MYCPAQSIVSPVYRPKPFCGKRAHFFAFYWRILNKVSVDHINNFRYHNGTYEVAHIQPLLHSSVCATIYTQRHSKSKQSMFIKKNNNVNNLELPGFWRPQVFFVHSTNINLKIHNIVDNAFKKTTYIFLHLFKQLSPQPTGSAFDF